jgi:hypothetical protein
VAGREATRAGGAWRIVAASPPPFRQQRAELPDDLPPTDRRGACTASSMTRPKLVLSLNLALGISACAHAGLPPPRLVVAARWTGHARGAGESAASVSLAVPLETRARARLPAPEPALAIPLEDAPQLSAPYGDEPTIDEVLDHAMRSASFDPDRARDARERARLSGLLPLLRADVRRGSGWDLRTQQGSALDGAVLASDDSWSVVGSVTLRLDRLLFAHEESSLLSEERRLEEARMRLTSEIVRLYHERRRLQLERDRSGSTDLATEARIAELGAMLEVLSGGGMAQRP